MKCLLACLTTWGGLKGGPVHAAKIRFSPKVSIQVRSWGKVSSYCQKGAKAQKEMTQATIKLLQMRVI